MSSLSSARIRIVIVDDHPMLREGVAAVVQTQPDMEMVGEAIDGVDAIEAFRRLRPDVTLMDLQMPRLDGVLAITAIREEFPQARIIVLTTYSGDVKALRALKAGAVGYLLKSSLRKELVETVRTVHQGRRHVPPELASEIAAFVMDDPLSAREIEILRLVAIGNANKSIAMALKISEDTVKAHLKSIFGKLRVADRTHAVTVAARRGFIDL
jgi:DNA-binding NarL/FixJ family response regulator